MQISEMLGIGVVYAVPAYLLLRASARKARPKLPPPPPPVRIPRNRMRPADRLATDAWTAVNIYFTIAGLVFFAKCAAVAWLIWG